MERIRISTEREDKRRDCRPVSMLVFLIAGVYGLLLFLKEVQGIFFDGFIIYPLCGAMCALAWAIYYHRRSLFFLYAAAATAFVCLAGYLCRGVLFLEAEGAVRGLLGLSEKAEPVTLLVLLASWFLVLLLFFLQIILRRHSVLYLLLAGLTLAAPLLGIWAGFEAVFLLLIFEAAFFAAHKAGSAGKGRLLTDNERERLAGRSSAYMGLILVLVLCLSVPVLQLFSERLFQSVYRAEGYLSRTLSSVLGTNNDLVKGGRVGRGNNYQTGTEQLTVRSTKQPEQTMYLKGFTGGLYVGGEWEAADDEPLLETASQAMGWENWLRTIEGMYENMYYTLNRNVWWKSTGETGMLIVNHLNGNYEELYAPYYAQQINENAYHLYGLEPEDGYGYWFYEQNQMHVRWDLPMGEFETQKGWYKELFEEYRKQAQSVYTQTPPGLVPGLTQLCRENPQESLEDITTFILYTLHSNADYSLTPGWVAFNEDVVEYFLFERKSGYCVHFASAAALMYRIFGIPARYAAGYAVQPGDFELQEDGTYLASVTDKAAHAWVEIFLDQYGWTPVEVTPSASGETEISYPGFDGEVLKRLMDEKGWDMEEPSIKESRTARQKEESSSVFRWGVKLRGGKLLPFLTDLFLYLICFVPLLFTLHRKRGMKKLETMGCQALFDRLMELLHFGSVLLECDGLEEDFAGRLAAAVPSITEAEAEQMLGFAMSAAYGQERDQEEARRCIQECYRSASELVYEQLPLWRKFLFRYWMVFG